ncbi:MAG: hypothetical protein KF688_18050 [Pirellulales bacterium]|nr:hypothetical protein [Pirellulales bacterium]
MDLDELHRRAIATRNDRDIEDFLRGAKDFVRYTVFSLLKRRNLRAHQWLADDVASDVAALVGKTVARLLHGDIENIGGFLYVMAKRVVTESVDDLLRPCGLGPCARTRRRNRSFESLHKRVYYHYEHGDAEDGVYNPVMPPQDADFPFELDSDSHYRTTSIGDNFVARPYQRGRRNEEYDNFKAWVEQQAWKYVGNDPRMRLAFARIKQSDDNEPDIAAIARSVGMARSTLRYRLDRLAEVVYRTAPPWVHRAGLIYLREHWTVPGVKAAA